MPNSSVASHPRQMHAKRPPNLSLQIGKRPTATTIIELQTPVEDDGEDEDKNFYENYAEDTKGKRKLV